MITAAPNRTERHLLAVEARRARLRPLLRELFSPGVSFVWEIGCGHGHFLNAYAAAHPREFCVGIDIIRDRIARADRKRNRAHLGNLHFVLTEAREFLDALPAGVAPNKIYILFPDPWPKRRHHKNRLMRTEFLRALAARVGEGTPLLFRTDFEPYFKDAVATVRAMPEWTIADESPAAWGFEHRTVFESRAAAHFSMLARRSVARVEPSHKPTRA